MERYMKSMPYRMIHVCIDQYTDYKISGRAYTPTFLDSIQFSDLNQLFLELDNIFNKNGNPQPSHSMRSFNQKIKIGNYQSRPPLVQSYPQLLEKKGDKITLDIVVISRRKSSWQGILFYQDQEILFDTILVLINRIVEILNE